MSELGSLLPRVAVPPPGPRSRALAERLRRVESRNVTSLGDRFPVFWEEAGGANVRDADGNVYLDLTGAFGVALAGHRHPHIQEALRSQAARLVHGMGDVHPPAVKVRLLEALSRLAPWPSTRVVLASAGSEAVEVALKTALRATGRPGILAFDGGYHGLTAGALAATARPFFREPFQARLYGGVAWAPFPEARGGEAEVARSLEAVDRVLRDGASGDPVGAVLVEPVQGRGGVRVPPRDFLPRMAELASRHGALVVADEIFTGLGRCGSVLASERLGLRPDLVCLGKALGGGLPLSACLGPADLMDTAWPPSSGEAVHTSTFLGHPLACASALAFLELLEEEDLPGRAAALGEELGAGLRGALRESPGVEEVRGLGLLLGIAPSDAAAVGASRSPGARVAEAALQRGILVLPAGDRGEVVELAPPVTLTAEQTRFAVEGLADAVREVWP